MTDKDEYVPVGGESFFGEEYIARPGFTAWLCRILTWVPIPDSLYHRLWDRGWGPPEDAGGGGGEKERGFG